MKYLTIAALALLAVPVEAQTQQTGAAYDSTYNNYLYDQRSAYFRGLPDTGGEIIFLGNSITHWGDWAELLKNARVRNRGIAGDISFGVLNRMDEVLSSRPAKLFIMIGANDIGRKIPLSVTVANYQKILKTVREKSPETKIYVQSVLPINDKLINRKYYTGTNGEIRKMNAELRQLAEKNAVPFIDLYQIFADEAGQLPEKYTYDGIHLSAAAYIRWTKTLKKKGFIR